ncbi:MAG: ribosome maturation factor RimP [Lachnospiraceae bacterium]|nr:ribosome maturation factor RimP [Lachnospiraceae bacterium]
MDKRSEYEMRAEALIEPIVSSKKFELVDVEYVKEGSDYYLRAYIDKEGGITIDDCELVSKAFEEKLDREDFIKDAYILEVSSPGLTRPLKKDKDFDRSIGKEIEIKTYKPINKIKAFEGTLKSYDNNTVTIESDGELITIERDNISLIRLAFVM